MPVRRARLARRPVAAVGRGGSPVAALAAIYMDPTQVGHAPIATGLLGFYLAHGVVVMMLLRMLALKSS